MGSDDDRLADHRPARHSPGVATTGWHLPTLAQAGAYRRQVQARREVLAMAEHQGDAGQGFALELAVGQAQGIEHRHIEGVAFGRAIQANEHDMLAQFAADVARAGVGHDGDPRNV